MQNELKVCQSCAMPMENVEVQGTNTDGSRNEDYCHYCFKDGSFTKEESMEEMIETCVPFVSNGNPWPNADAARAAMAEIFPKLKRWSK